MEGWRGVSQAPLSCGSNECVVVGGGVCCEINWKRKALGVCGASASGRPAFIPFGGMRQAAPRVERAHQKEKKDKNKKRNSVEREQEYRQRGRRQRTASERRERHPDGT